MVLLNIIFLIVISYIPLSFTFSTTRRTYRTLAVQVYHHHHHSWIKHGGVNSKLLLAKESIQQQQQEQQQEQQSIHNVIIPTNWNDNQNNNSSNTSTQQTQDTVLFINNMTMTKNLSSSWLTESVLLLNIVAILWGTQHAIIKLVVEDSNVASWSLTRFGLAALLASPFTPPIIIPTSTASSNSIHEIDIHSNTNNNTWRWGLEMGFYMFLGYAFQAIGLENTTAQRSGFLLYLNVKFVPFLARILLGRVISIPTWLTALIAFTGTLLLSYDGIHPPTLNVGDIWSIAAALASAMFILRLERASQVIPNSAALNSTTLWIVTLLSLLWCILDIYTSSPSSIILQEDESLLLTIQQHSLLSSNPHHVYSIIQQIIDSVMNTIGQHPWELIYLGGITTALCNYIQTKAQGGISAERAAVIYAMDPVYGAITSYFVLGEELNMYGLVGALLITAAAAVNTSMDVTTSSISSKEEEESG